MTRREFSVAFAGAVASSDFAAGNSSSVVILKAIAGARLPETLEVKTNFPEKMRKGVWELRTYRGATAMLADYFSSVFPRTGIRPQAQRTDGVSLTYLIPFENLTARERAWTALNADPQWPSANPRFQSYHFGLYEAVEPATAAAV